MKVQDLINVLMRCELDAPIVMWEQGLLYGIELTRKDGYYTLSASR